MPPSRKELRRQAALREEERRQLQHEMREIPCLLENLAHARSANDAEIALSYDLPTLMWAMRNLDTRAFPNRRIIIRFRFLDEPCSLCL